MAGGVMRPCTCPPGTMTPHEEGYNYLAGFMTEREAAIFAYLYTIAEPPGPSSSAVARHYLKEKLDWLRERVKYGGDMYANLDPARKRKALTMLYESGIITIERAAQAIGADSETLEAYWTPPQEDVDALVEKIWKRLIGSEELEGFVGSPPVGAAIGNVEGAAAAIVLRAMDAGNVPKCPVVTGTGPGPSVPFVRVTAKEGDAEGEVVVTLAGPPWVAILMPGGEVETE